ncbi:hypothetical protein JOL62DRAFT_578962 [Phyllosticta paracitricarpa]|uniref:Uncharacterized protein n=1 Tax=Phyllosticta paracitricarpa TaxID=2016321 RepID=A0ABR1N468_9PEZI
MHPSRLYDCRHFAVSANMRLGGHLLYQLQVANEQRVNLQCSSITDRLSRHYIHDTQLHLRGFPRLGRCICEMDARGTMHARSLLACLLACWPGLAWMFAVCVLRCEGGRLASAWPAALLPRHDEDDEGPQVDVGPVHEARTQSQKASRSKHSTSTSARRP